MINFQLLFLMNILLALSACSGEDKIQKDIYGYSQKEIITAGKVCRDAIAQASRRDAPNRWSEWAKCEKQQKMHIDIQMFNLDSKAIEEVYDNRIKRLGILEKDYESLSPNKFQEKLDEIYDLYNSEKANAGANICLNWAKDKSGNKVCTEYPKIWAAYNNGAWRPIPYFY